MQRYCILSGAIRAERQPSRSRGGLLFSWRLTRYSTTHTPDDRLFPLQPVVIRLPPVFAIRQLRKGVVEVKLIS